MQKLEKFILDYSKWRSGGNEEYQVGRGNVRLLNRAGFMCCLGQYCLQAGIDRKLLRDAPSPEDLFLDQEAQNKIGILLSPKINNMNSDFAMNAVCINDDEAETPLLRLQYLKELFNSEDIEFEVINAPTEIMQEINKS